MLLDRLYENKKYCTGCTACSQICPANAIKMIPNEEGFYIPYINSVLCINCKKCEGICPQINISNYNFDSPKCFAIMAKDELRAVSSSGGLFGSLAEYVFSKGGLVCGAAFDKDFRGVSHILISDSSELYKMHGSKYVYSKVEGIFKAVREKLDEGELVLFSGCPCQVAGLNNFLGKKYENLLTVDLLCGGIPSEYVFRTYIDEISKEKEISSISFRPKEAGWNCLKMKITFKDGSVLFRAGKDPYMAGFLNDLFKSKACNNCSFASIPRQADISIGDFWSIERYFPELETELGVSCLLLNNKKAESIFEKICDKLQWVKPVPLSFLSRYNRLSPQKIMHLARPRFFKLIEDGFSIKKAVDYSLNWKFDIAITGCWTVVNYGGELTYYAMYKFLKDKGYTVIMVERRIDIQNYDVPNPSMFRNNPYPFYDIARIHKNFQDQKELNNRVYTFILGSDQVWNYKLMGESVNSYSLDYVADWKKRICYAPSFGVNTFLGDEKQKNEFLKLVQKFDYISVREKAGVNILKNEFNVNAEWVLDPIFLCDKKHYDKLLENATVRTKGNYMFTYFMQLDKSKYGIDELSQMWQLGLINTIDAGKTKTGADTSFLSYWPYPYEYNCKLENWLYYLISSDIVITDSFHASCLAIIYGKPFVFVKGNLRVEERGGRISTILETLGLEDRLVDTVQDVINQAKRLRTIDYTSAYKILELEKKRCEEWLYRAITS